MKLKRIGLDTSKAVFTLHRVDHDEKVVLRRNTRRAEMEAFFAKLPPTHIALEACGGSHHWGRRLTARGHTVQGYAIEQRLMNFSPRMASAKRRRPKP